MVFMTLDMLSNIDAAYASLLLDQNNFQASEATPKVPNLFPLNIAISSSTDTLNMALTNLPDQIACIYHLHHIELPLTAEINLIFLAKTKTLFPTPPASFHPSFKH